MHASLKHGGCSHHQSDLHHDAVINEVPASAAAADDGDNNRMWKELADCDMSCL